MDERMRLTGGMSHMTEPAKASVSRGSQRENGREDRWTGRRETGDWRVSLKGQRGCKGADSAGAW